MKEQMGRSKFFHKTANGLIFPVFCIIIVLVSTSHVYI